MNRWGFETHEQAKNFDLFTNLVQDALDNVLIPASDELRTIIQTKSKWIRTKRNEKTEKSLRLLTIIFGLVGALEVFVAYVQIIQSQIFGVALTLLQNSVLVLLLVLSISVAYLYFKLYR